MFLKWFCWTGLGLYAVLSVADWMLTFSLLRAHPGAVESNPLAAACLEQHGWRGLALFKLGGVAAFAAAVALIIRRRPAVAAGVVAFGCGALLWVTTYSHGLLCQAHRDARELAENVWPRLKEPDPALSAGYSVPERCWFAGDERPAPVQSAAVSRERSAP